MDIKRKETFQKIKSQVLKKYPNAKTQIDSSGHYYVADENGRDILNLPILDNLKEADLRNINDIATFLRKTPSIPHSTSVYEAWAKVEVAINAHKIINVNTDRFSDEKGPRPPSNYE